MHQDLVRRFDARAAHAPESVAVIDGDRTFTYRQLAELSSALARRLIAAGAAPGDVVGLSSDRSGEWVVAILAILRTGAAYLPLPPDLPLERRRLLMREAGVRHVLRHPDVDDDLADVAVMVDMCGAAMLDAADDSAPVLPPPGEHADRACVLFTSGTTGPPKGVIVRQSSIIRLVIDTNYIDISSSDAMAFASNTAFDAVTFEVWGALLNGCRLVVVSTPTLLSSSALETAIRTHGISILFLTTELFNRMARVRPTAFRSLGWLLFGGEKANAECVRAVLGGNGTPRNLLHMYGPTECTTFATSLRVTEVPDDAMTVPIGTAISGTTIHLLDEHLRPVPDGEEGEICIAGAGLAEGYLHRRVESAAVFTTFCTDGEENRIYRTGDLARRRGGGPIEYNGRRDGQIKFHGFRIETGEIESTLVRHHAVRDAIALVYAGVGDTPRLGACVVVEGDDVNLDAVAEFAREYLPAPMVPSRLRAYGSFPLTDSKKVDRRQLLADLRAADLDAAAGGSPRRFVPANGAERGLATIWKAVLGRDPVHVDENFFDAGGDSLQAVDLQARIEHTWKIALSPAILLEAPSFGQLADHVRRSRSPDIRPVVWLTPESRRPVIACVPGVFGHVFFFRNLVTVWPDDWGMCALPSRYLDPRADRRLLTIEEIAAENLARLEHAGLGAVDAVAGYSFGGLVAYEMARRLAERGTPPALILFDTAAEGEQFRGETSPLRSFPRVHRVLRRLRFHAHQTLYRWLAPHGIGPSATRFNPAGLANLDATDRYVPRPYEGGMLLVRATAERSVLCVDPKTMGWGPLVGGPLTVRDVAAAHLDLFKPPHVSEVAAMTVEYLRHWNSNRHQSGAV